MVVDRISPKKRSELMGRIRSKNTRPELLVRKIVFGLGYRYRLHARDLPGRPDLVFRAKKKVVFVHGCFWHRHLNCSIAHMPKSRIRFWKHKLEGNRQRDEKNKKALAKQGWAVLTIWECEMKNALELEKQLRDFLESKL